MPPHCYCDTMRRLVLVFDDAVFEALRNTKMASGLTWEKFVLSRCAGKKIRK